MNKVTEELIIIVTVIGIGLSLFITHTIFIAALTILTILIIGTDLYDIIFPEVKEVVG